MTQRVDGGVTTPAGFTAAGVACGLKANGKPDLALIVSARRASAAGVFTTNRAQAAPVLLSRAHLEKTGGMAQAIVVNSGCANACTGDGGVAAAEAMAAAAAAAVGCAIEDVLVASTGVIGVSLDVGKVRRGVAAAAAALGPNGPDAARAIMTTDPFPKEAAVRANTPAGAFTVGGMAKGSGMIEPRMATMLGFVTTDAAVPPAMLLRALLEASNLSFNAITVDGECSTNDTVFALANGASGVTIDEAGYPVFLEALLAVCHELAIGIVRGGEGATKLITVRVTGAATLDDARTAARIIANSPLVKTAVHGGDPNWGRLIAAAGRAGVAMSLPHAEVRIGAITLFSDGQPFDDRAPAAAEYLKRPEVELEVNLGSGTHEATMWTCDLTAEYVRINAEYRT